MAWFSYARSEGFPTQYPPVRSPVSVDVLEAGFIAFFVILLLCFFVSLPSTRLKNNAFLFIRITLSLLIGLFILLANFGQEWEIAHITTKTQYRAGIDVDINATIGVRIGLRSVNVTLNSVPDKNSKLANEVINYNERFEWTWDQGRFGFGPNAGKLQRQFREGQRRGLPLPILWVVDYFVIDGEGFRFGRFYRTAGWYTHIILWTAFPCWMLALIFFRSVIRYGAYFLGMAGGLLLFANLLWLVIRNPNPLVIHFEDEAIRTTFGFSYWLTFSTGIICLILSAVIIFLEATNDAAVSIFFGIDPLTYLDEYILTQKEFEVLRRKDDIPRDMLPLADMEAGTSDTADLEANTTQTVYLKRRTTIKGGLAHIKRILPAPPKEEDEQPLYGNMDTIREEQQKFEMQNPKYL